MPEERETHVCHGFAISRRPAHHRRQPVGVGALPATHLDRTTASSITGSETSPTPADLSADLRGAWRPGLLYFAAAVTDDVLVGNQNIRPWNDDAVELSLQVPSTGKTHQFTIGLDGSQYDNGAAISSLTVMTRTVPGGWTLETAIPAWVLGLDALAAGQEYPFTFGLWDDDTRSAAAQTHMLWRGTVTDTYQPDWGTLQLMQHRLRLPDRPNANAYRHADADADTGAHRHAHPDTDCFGLCAASGRTG